MPTDIFVTNTDKERIKKLMEKMLKGNHQPDASIKKLEGEIKRAVVVDSNQIPGDVITMNTRVLLHLNDEDMEVSLTYPEDAHLADMKLSVFSPIGTAILGYKEGNIIEWDVPVGTSKIHIKKIIYQPEAAGDYHL
ncbi:MAG: GreA/GreB family elongation factor [Clostridiaceae bacterium]|nr:GreA/GreB family elongation factor [Clostridiaceae bacterium]